MPLFGANSNSADDFTVVHTEVIKPLARAGAAVLAVDHLPKNAESRKHGPTGTGAKTRTVGGVAVRVSSERAFRPGEGGTARLELHKDRHGGVRRLLTVGDVRPVIGTFKLTEQDGQMHYGFESAFKVPINRAASDTERAQDDVARLLDLHRSGESLDTVRDVKTALRCGQPRAEAVLAAFREATTNCLESVA